MNSLDRSVSRTLRGLAAGLGLGACLVTLLGAEGTQTAVAPGRATAQSATRVGQWEPIELSMTADHDFANAYVETLPDDGKPYVQITFAGTSGEAKGLRHTVTGFWDGGKDWKARFAPPAPGEWSYSSTSSDAGLQPVQGSFQCTGWTAEEKAANPARRGFVRVVSQGPRAGRHFEYADGRPFLWIGDTWWAWARKGAPIERFQQVVDDRSSRGFSVGQYMYCANNASRLVGRDFSTPDFESIHNAERMIAYANSKGITLWIGAWWSAKDLDQQAGPEKIRRWWRYTIQRLGAYNVMWNIAGEYNMYNYGGLGLQFWKDTGALIRKEDPYRHALGVHNTPPGWAAGEMGDSAQWSTSSKLNDEPWLDFHNSQTGHAKWRSELVPGIISSDYALTPHRPTLITEPWYEFAEGSAPAMDVRFAAWSAFLSGAAGHTYGGGDQWWARVPKLSTPPAGAANRSSSASDGGGWPRPDPGQDTLDFPGAASMGYMAKLLRGLEWWKLEPHPESVREYAQPLAAAIPGQEYLVYARYGGRFKLDLSACPPTDRFKVTWIDLVTSKESRSAFINGGSLVGCQAPEDFPSNRDYKDWLVHVVKVP